MGKIFKKERQIVRRIALFIVMVSLTGIIYAQIPQGYYNRALNKSGHELQAALHEIIKGHTRIPYDDLWPYFLLTDPAPGDSALIMDIYSNCTFTVDQHGTTGSEYCEIYNREHSFCQSWMGVSDYYHASDPCRSDLHHIYPVDSRMNSTRNNNPYSMVTGEDAILYDNGSKLGDNSYFCAFDSVPQGQNAFEPADQYKGDIARTLFYMSVRYLNEDSTFTSSYGMNDKSQLRPWAQELMMMWHRNDPVSQKELARNNAIYYNIQGNRNPFIDHPELVELIWGNDSAISTFQDNYQPVVRPRVTDWQIVNSRTLKITFDSLMRHASLLPSTNYYLNSTIVDSVDTRNDLQITLFFDDDMVTGNSYHLAIRRCQSQSGVYMNDTILTFLFGEPVFVGWTFDSVATETLDSIRIIDANYGEMMENATLYFNGEYGSSDIPDTQLTIAAPEGTGLGDPRDPRYSGVSFGVKNYYDQSFVLRFSSFGYEDLEFKYAMRPTPATFQKYYHEWSTDGINYHLFGDTVRLNPDDYWYYALYLYDLDTIPEIQRQPQVFIRVTMQEGLHPSGNARFDNICIHGTKCSDSLYYQIDTCTSYEWHGETLTESGMYTRNFISSQGCDSVEVLHLSVHPSYSQDLYQTACDHYVWNHDTLTDNGIYTCDFITACGCDSTVRLHLTISDVLTTDLFENACEQFVWDGQTYSESDVYTHTYTSANGCDSIVTLTLNIYETPTATISGESTIQVGQTAVLTASPADDYLWSTGADSQSISVSPIVPAVYCVTVSNGHTCFDTACFNIDVLNGITENDVRQVMIYPNPVNGMLNIEAPGIAEVRLYNLFGQLLQTVRSVGSDLLQINTQHHSAGIYLIHVRLRDGESCNRKIVVKH